MSTRFSWFSHLENLKTGSLVLEDPFQVPVNQGSVCRYQLQRAPTQAIEPDKAHQGLAAWHRLLPFNPGDAMLTEPVLRLNPTEHPFSEDTASLHHVHANKQLPHRLAASFSQSAVDTPWTNPYRLEAYKALGLALAHHYADCTPALVVVDPIGELLTGLMLASENIRALQADRMPYRLILVQVRPNHQLGQAFEGGEPDWSGIDEQRRPPETIPSLLAQALQIHLGTAVILEPDEAGDLFTPALHKLVRTGFVDDEDAVVLID